MERLLNVLPKRLTINVQRTFDQRTISTSYKR